MGRFGHSTPDTIRESHDILAEVMAGRVTPHCQRAQRAYRVATKYPLSELDRELEEARTPQTLTPPPVVVERAPPPPAPSDVMLSAVFGSLAPQVKNVSRFLASPTGSKVAVVGGVALASLLAPKVIP